MPTVSVIPGSTLTETERAAAIETAKAITNAHLNAVLDILQTKRPLGDDGAEYAIINQHHRLETVPIIEFVTNTYNLAFDTAVDQLMHARL